MKFDVIIGNPPYQLTTNTEDRIAAKQAKPIFQFFVTQAKKLKPRYISMIIPARWYSGGIGLSEFREDMIHDKHIIKLVDYANSKDCFDGVEIAGGICYFLWSNEKTDKCEVKNYNNGEYTVSERALDEFEDVFIRSNSAMSIIHKIQQEVKDNTLINQVYSLDAFGIPTSARGKEKKFNDCVTLVHSKGIGYISKSEVIKNKDLIDKWKVTIARIVPCNGEVGIDPKKGYKSITTPKILKPNEVNTFSYIVLGAFESQAEAENFKKYMMCKLPRFLLRLTYSSMNIAKNNFKFVPKLNFNKEWTDSELYKHFKLSNNEVELIESTMRTMTQSSDGDTNEQE